MTKFLNLVNVQEAMFEEENFLKFYYRVHVLQRVTINLRVVRAMCEII